MVRPPFFCGAAFLSFFGVVLLSRRGWRFPFLLLLSGAPFVSFSGCGCRCPFFWMEGENNWLKFFKNNKIFEKKRNFILKLNKQNYSEFKFLVFVSSVCFFKDSWKGQRSLCQTWKNEPGWNRRGSERPQKVPLSCGWYVWVSRKSVSSLAVQMGSCLQIFEKFFDFDVVEFFFLITSFWKCLKVSKIKFR